jgi:hypothetical protein
MQMLRWTIAHEMPERRGHRTPATLAAIDERNRLMGEAVARFMPGESSRRAAHRLHDALVRYACGAWRRDRAAPSCPPRHAGHIEAILWEILRLHDHVPSFGTIRAAIGPNRTAFR